MNRQPENSPDPSGLAPLLQWIRGMCSDEEPHHLIDAKIAEAANLADSLREAFVERNENANRAWQEAEKRGAAAIDLAKDRAEAVALLRRIANPGTASRTEAIVEARAWLEESRAA